MPVVSYAPRPQQTGAVENVSRVIILILCVCVSTTSLKEQSAKGIFPRNTLVWNDKQRDRLTSVGAAPGKGKRAFGWLLPALSVTGVVNTSLKETNSVWCEV